MRIRMPNLKYIRKDEMAFDDTINSYPVQGLNSYDGLRDWMQP
jgi:hypothetical protein